MSPRHIVSAVAVAVDLILLATFVPGLAGYRMVPVESDRLAPEIPMGAMLVEGPVTAERLEPGDVISLMTPQAPGTIFTDRVREVADNAGTQTVDVRTRPIGADEERDWHVYRSQPIGKVLYWVPLTGLLFHFPIPQVLFGGTASLLCCMWAVSKLRTRRRQGFDDNRPTTPAAAGEASPA